MRGESVCAPQLLQFAHCNDAKAYWRQQICGAWIRTLFCSSLTKVRVKSCAQQHLKVCHNLAVSFVYCFPKSLSCGPVEKCSKKKKKKLVNSTDKLKELSMIVYFLKQSSLIKNRIIGIYMTLFNSLLMVLEFLGFVSLDFVAFYLKHQFCKPFVYQAFLRWVILLVLMRPFECIMLSTRSQVQLLQKWGFMWILIQCSLSI